MKRGDGVRQCAAGPSEPQGEPSHLGYASLDRFCGVHLTTTQTAKYLEFPSVNALRCAMKRGVHPPRWTWTKIGRRVRFIRRFLDEYVAAQNADAEPMRAGHHGHGRKDARPA